MSIKTINAKGKEICIFYGADGDYYVRVYESEHEYKDYSIRFTDLFATVTSEDICFYEPEDGMGWIDHSPEVYGKEQP